MKVNITKHPDVASHYEACNNINDISARYFSPFFVLTCSPAAQVAQLPTLILFKRGKSVEKMV